MTRPTDLPRVLAIDVELVDRRKVAVLATFRRWPDDSPVAVYEARIDAELAELTGRATVTGLRSQTEIR